MLHEHYSIFTTKDLVTLTLKQPRSTTNNKNDIVCAYEESALLLQCQCNIMRFICVNVSYAYVARDTYENAYVRGY